MKKQELKQLIKETLNEMQYNQDAVNFANEIREKMMDRIRKKGYDDMHYPDAIRDMIAFKLTKEGWTKPITNI